MLWLTGPKLTELDGHKWDSEAMECFICKLLLLGIFYTQSEPTSLFSALLQNMKAGASVSPLSKWEEWQCSRLAGGSRCSRMLIKLLTAAGAAESDRPLTALKSQQNAVVVVALHTLGTPGTHNTDKVGRPHTHRQQAGHANRRLPFQICLFVTVIHGGIRKIKRTKKRRRKKSSKNCPL